MGLNCRFFFFLIQALPSERRLHREATGLRSIATQDPGPQEALCQPRSSPQKYLRRSPGDQRLLKRRRSGPRGAEGRSRRTAAAVPAQAGDSPSADPPPAPSPPIRAAPGHLTYTPSPGDPPTEAAGRGPQPQTPPQACCNAHPTLQPPLPAAALPIGELRVEGAGLEAGQGSTQHSPAPPTASSGGRSSDWRTERGGRSLEAGRWPEVLEGARSAAESRGLSLTLELLLWAGTWSEFSGVFERHGRAWVYLWGCWRIP